MTVLCHSKFAHFSNFVSFLPHFVFDNQQRFLKVQLNTQCLSMEDLSEIVYHFSSMKRMSQSLSMKDLSEIVYYFSSMNFSTYFRYNKKHSTRNKVCSLCKTIFFHFHFDENEIYEFYKREEEKEISIESMIKVLISIREILIFFFILENINTPVQTEELRVAVVPSELSRRTQVRGERGGGGERVISH